MSYILDALRKSENERQKKDTPDITAARYKTAPSRSGIWLPIVGAVLLINALLLVFLLFRSDGEATAPNTTNVVELPATPVSPSRMAPSARPAPSVRPLAREVVPATSSTRSDSVAASPPPKAAAPATVFTPTPAPATTTDSSSGGGLPSMQQLVLDGALVMNPLRLDMHVYSPVPAERFVFINMSKYREGEQLKEGPKLESIDTSGVILTHQGQRFTLERQ